MVRPLSHSRWIPVVVLLLGAQQSACCGGDPPAKPTIATSAAPSPSSTARGSTPREWLVGKWRYTSPSAKQLGEMEKRAKSVAERDRIRESMGDLPRISREYTTSARTTFHDTRITMKEDYEIIKEEGETLTLRFAVHDGGAPRDEVVVVRTPNMILETVKGMPYELVRE